MLNFLQGNRGRDLNVKKKWVYFMAKSLNAVVVLNKSGDSTCPDLFKIKR